MTTYPATREKILRHLDGSIDYEAYDARARVIRNSAFATIGRALKVAVSKLTGVLRNLVCQRFLKRIEKLWSRTRPLGVDSMTNLEIA